MLRLYKTLARPHVECMKSIIQEGEKYWRWFRYIKIIVNVNDG